MGESGKARTHRPPRRRPNAARGGPRLRAILRPTGIASPSGHRGQVRADTEEANRRAALWQDADPFPDIPPALLNSADLDDYIAATAMLHPWPVPLANGPLMKAATCCLPLGGEYLTFDAPSGELVRRNTDNDGEATIQLRPNSITFVTVEPTFRLPLYMAARYDLRVSHVYQGLLLGTGPLVDPGFKGRLHFPLHNLTTNVYDLAAGDGIIWVEFTKLSPRRDAVRPSVSPPQRTGVFQPFPEDKLARQGIGDYLFPATQHRPVMSSLSEALLDAKERATNAESHAASAQAAAERLRNFQVLALIVAGISLLALVVAVLQLTQQTGQLVGELNRSRPSAAPAPPAIQQAPTAPPPVASVRPPLASPSPR